MNSWKKLLFKTGIEAGLELKWYRTWSKNLKARSRTKSGTFDGRSFMLDRKYCNGKRSREKAESKNKVREISLLFKQAN